jgi:ankyrin repeat protein
MPPSLPLRANLEWLKKLSKERLVELRALNPQAKLSEAQRDLARELGFASWRALKGYVEQLRHELGKLATAGPDDVLAAPDDSEFLRFMSAIGAGETQTVVQLLQQRPILAQSRGADGQTPLHLAARYNDPALGVWLLAYGADPEARFGQSGHTPLSWAATCNAPDFAEGLVRLGVKPDLFCAAGLGLGDILRSCFDNAGQLLPNASRTGSSRFSSTGTRLSCPPERAREQISDALAMASRNAQLDSVRFLLSKDPDLRFRGFMGGTALHWAYFGGNGTIVELLIQAGADKQARDDVLRCTPQAFGVAVAASWGFDFIVRKLLASDPSLANAVDTHTSPLHEAARCGHAHVVQLLLAQKADASFRNDQGKTPGEVAAESGHSAIAEMLKGT